LCHPVAYADGAFEQKSVWAQRLLGMWGSGCSGMLDQQTDGMS